MKASEFHPNLADGFTAHCERCNEKALTLTSWIDWDERVFTCLYQCPRCGNVDWFAFNGEPAEKPEGVDNGYL
uniref:Uncharacterized protein n=1 Tax=viral metagenome TaxID=1070528 RepID=A0A6M3J7H2_9ZZZZ